jgi:hypothetical protein
MVGFKRTGFWWSTMGFTSTHAVGVFFTESLLCLLGIGAGFASVVAAPELSLRLLVGAACLFLLAIAVLLASILSLLFYLGSQGQSATPSPSEDAEPTDCNRAADRVGPEVRRV